MTLPDSTRTFTEVDLGPETSFEKLPAPVKTRMRDYFLARNDDGVYRLLSIVCPHQFGAIIEWDNCFMCPDHGWRFALTDGICINGPNAQMESVPVIARDGHLFAQFPPRRTQPRP